MAGKRISMHQIKQIVEFFSKDYGVRTIVRLTGISRNTVRDYKLRINASKLSYEELLALDEESLAAVMERSSLEEETTSTRKNDFANRLDYFFSELGRKGVTRQLLWDEYRSENPDGYSYSQFCEQLSKQLKVKDAVMYFKHHPGEQMMVDYSGNTDPSILAY